MSRSLFVAACRTMFLSGFFVALLSTPCAAQAPFQGPMLQGPAPVSGCPMRESNIVPFTSGMFSNFMPSVQNLQFGFQYFFGESFRGGRSSADYVFPVKVGSDEVLFGEARGNYWYYDDKAKTAAGWSADYSLGGGYRRLFSDTALAGVNAFYNGSKPYDQWYSSGSFGLEMAANVGMLDAADFHFNLYFGNLFSSTAIDDAFRKPGVSYDFEAGYSSPLFNAAIDVRLKAAGYQFDVGDKAFGYMVGSDLTTRNGIFTVSYEHGGDRVNGPWNKIGAFVDVGFLIGNYFIGENPFTLPEPVFRGRRNLRSALSSPVTMAPTPVPPTPPSPTPPSNFSGFALANAVIPPPGAAQPFFLPFNVPLVFPPGNSTSSATITVANPPPTPVLIALYNGRGGNTRSLWIALQSQTISQTDFPDWFAGTWTGIQIINNVNEGLSTWIPVSFSITYQ